ncbi:MAG: polymorphic toxin-type HINT domain-containing protein, partial [Planctomycetaceae bacterium]
AEVLAIEPCPPLASGPGRTVTGTFAHAAADVLDLEIEGLDTPLGCTANHPFWSADRHDFVPAGALTIGEHLQTESGTLRQVTRITPRRGPPVAVFNLEVDAEHVYYVSTAGVLVHNAYPGGGGRENTPLATRPSARDSEFDIISRNPKHRPQVSFKNGQEVTYGSKGSVRPDAFTFGEALEIKNYELSHSVNRANMYNRIHMQYLQRLSNLPKRTHQRIVIDIRGQNLPESILMRVRCNILTITSSSNTTVDFLR